MARSIHLIGPGGAGKTTVGRLLAERLGCAFLDLDQVFMKRHGDIAAHMAAHGYQGYARANVAVYEEAMAAASGPAVIALSSGFMTYPLNIDARYPALRAAIEADALTALLLPAFDAESCVDIIVRRQLSRPCLRGDRVSEEQRIRERFPAFMGLRCARFRSDAAPDHIVQEIERFMRARQAGQASATPSCVASSATSVATSSPATATP